MKEPVTSREAVWGLSMSIMAKGWGKLHGQSDWL